MKTMTAKRWFKRYIDNPEEHYLAVEELLRQFGPIYGAGDSKIIPNGFFWSALAVNVLLKTREYSANPVQNECSNKDEEVTQYSFMHTETTLLMLAIVVLSWLTVDIKKKADGGHCHNPIHKQAGNKPAECSIGSRFHIQLYNDYVKLLENFLNTVKQREPSVT
jgi:hypothetical protein